METDGYIRINTATGCTFIFICIETELGIGKHTCSYVSIYRGMLVYTKVHTQFALFSVFFCFVFFFVQQTPDLFHLLSFENLSQ